MVEPVALNMVEEEVYLLLVYASVVLETNYLKRNGSIPNFLRNVYF